MKQLTQQEIQSVNGAILSTTYAALAGAAITTVGWAGMVLYDQTVLYPLFDWKNYAIISSVGAVAGITANLM